MRVGIVTGMRDEAALVPPSEAVTAYCEGPGPDAARQAAERAVADGATVLMSFGLAGGLDPALTTGTPVLASAVVLADGTRIETDAAWRDRLAGMNETAKTAPLATAERPVVTVADKQLLFAATGAAAVDMESAAVAGVARAAGLPFAALRVTADPAGRAIPRAALAGMRPDGTIDSATVMRAVAARPRDLPGLVRLAGDYRRAQRVLRDVALRIARRLGGA